MGLFDYAGMFQPAELDLRDAVRGYLEYRGGPHAWALGNLVLSAPQLGALQEEPQDARHDLRLSVLATMADLEMLQKYLDDGLPIKMIELKASKPDEIAHWKEKLFARVATYVEMPVESQDSRVLEAIHNTGLRAKLRMGGVVAEAFPTGASVAAILKRLAERRIAFKATAGLHHPLRSRHPFTYRQDSELGMMHGFVNLLCASALVWFGADEGEAEQLLEEQDPRAWQMSSDAVRWRSHQWSADQLREVREHFLISIGSCSFTEPMHDLEALGWL